MHKFFIVMSGGLYGHFGKGYTLDQAQAAWKKAGGRKKEGGYKEYAFLSSLPFAPIEKLKADDNEADAWVGRDGSLNWVRCEKLVLTGEEAAPQSSS